MPTENPDQPNTFDETPNVEDGPSTPMLEAATYGQVLDDNNASGQVNSDQEDDSLRVDIQARNAAGPAPASDENLPRELTNPSDRAYTLPEEQTPR